MKSRLIFLMILLLCATPAWAGIYNNSGTTAEDSICFVGFNLSADGRRCLSITAASDSLYVLVFYPGGTLAFRDSMLMDNAKVTIAGFEDQVTVSAFTYKNAVASVDGGSTNGTYKVAYFVRDIDSANTTSMLTEAQVYATNNLSEKLDSTTQIPTGEITTGSFTAAAVDAAAIAPDAIGASEIASAAIAADEIATDAIGAAEIASAAIAADEIATDAIGAAEIASAAIAADEIATDAIGASELAADAIGSSELAGTAAGEITDSTRDALGDTVDAVSGNVAINWGDVSNPTTTLDLSNTLIRHADTVDYAVATGDAARLDSILKMAQATASQVGINPAARRRFVTKAGNDANDGLSWETAWLTFEKARAISNADSTTFNPTPFYAYFGPGEWTETVACTLKSDNTHWIGSGYGRSVIRRSAYTSNGDAVIRLGGATTTTTATHVEFSSLEMYGYDTTGNPGNYVIRGFFADSVEIHDCNLKKAYVAIGLDDGCDGWWIHHNTIRYGTVDGMAITGNDNWIHDNLIVGDSSEVGFDGIATSGQRNFIFRNAITANMGGIATVTTAYKTAIVGNWVSTDDISTQRAYQAGANDSTRYAGNYGPSRLAFALGGLDDSAASLQDELFLLYKRVHLDSLLGDLSPAQIAQDAADKIGFYTNNMGDDSGSWISGADTSVMAHLRLGGQAGTATVSAGNMGSIADSVFRKATNGGPVYGAGTFGNLFVNDSTALKAVRDSMDEASQTSALSAASMGSIADSVFRKATVGGPAYGAGTFGNLFRNDSIALRAVGDTVRDVIGDTLNAVGGFIYADIQAVGSDAIVDNADGLLEVNIEEVNDNATAANDLEDFTIAGYDPSADAVEGIKYAKYTSLNYDIRIGNALHYLVYGQQNPMLSSGNLVPNSSFELSVGTASTNYPEDVTNFGDNDLVGSVNLSDGAVNDTLGYWDCDSCAASAAIRFAQTNGSHWGRQSLYVSPSVDNARINVNSSYFPLDSGMTYLVGLWAKFDVTDKPDTCYLGLHDTTSSLNNTPAFKKLLLSPYENASYGHNSFRLYQTTYTHILRNQPGRVVIYGRYNDSGTPIHKFDDVFVIPMSDTLLMAATNGAITASQMGFISDSVWAKDTNNVLWNGLSRFGEYNALAQAATGASAVSSFDHHVVEFRGVVTRGWVSAFVATALTQANDYWNDNQVLFVTGAAAGQVAGIVDFVAATDSVDIRPDLSIAPAVGDSFYIVGLLAPALPTDVTAGTGPQVVSMTLLDTSGADAVLAGQNITIYNDGLTGNPITATTSGSGVATFNLFPSTAYDVIAAIPGFIFPNYDMTTGSGASFSDTLMGYNITMPSPTAANVKRIYVDVGDLAPDTDSLKLQNATLSVEFVSPINDTIPYDTTNSQTIGRNWMRTVNANGKVNGAGAQVGPKGRAIIDLRRTDLMKPWGCQYKFVLRDSAGRVLLEDIGEASGAATANLLNILN